MTMGAENMNFSPRVEAVDNDNIETPDYITDGLKKLKEEIKTESSVALKEVKKDVALTQMSQLSSELGEKWNLKTLSSKDAIKVSFLVQSFLAAQ